MISNGRKEHHTKKVTYAKALGHERLNVQMDYGQIEYENRIDLQSATTSPENQPLHYSDQPRMPAGYLEVRHVGN